MTNKKISITSAKIASSMLTIDSKIWESVLENYIQSIIERENPDYDLCCEIADSDDVGHEIGELAPEGDSIEHEAMNEARAILQLAGCLKSCSPSDVVGAFRLIEMDQQRKGIICPEDNSITNEILLRIF